MRILIADDEANARYGMLRALAGDGRELIEAEDGEQAWSLIQETFPDLLYLDLNMPRLAGLELLQRFAQHPAISKPEIIVVTANDTVDQAIECIRAGADDFLTKPYEVERLRAIARRAQRRVAMQTTVAALQLQLAMPPGLGSLLGISLPMKQLFERIPRAAGAALPVLIRGESGTGKELLAREIHRSSARADGPYVAVNTAAISATLIESELFGHVKGAFTGADRQREGVFRSAHGGTLFLDEIGDMPVAVQTRLLRVLQEGVVQPVGSEQSIQVDVRVISATHQNLEQAIEEKLFRPDLYFRLRGIELCIPPLRQRPEDIVLLAGHFLGGARHFTADAMTALLQHPWLGNVRELKQRVESASAMAEKERITRSDLGLQPATKSGDRSHFDKYWDLPLTEAKSQLIEEFETLAIERALLLESGNISAAARRLGIHRQSLQHKLKTGGLDNKAN
ncbi:MAG: sigma-54 dependent transcriptional regulator, partial [Aureliella sp.]